MLVFPFVAVAELCMVTIICGSGLSIVGWFGSVPFEVASRSRSVDTVDTL
jgi:hypothetical protein